MHTMVGEAGDPELLEPSQIEMFHVEHWANTSTCHEAEFSQTLAKRPSSIQFIF